MIQAVHEHLRAVAGGLGHAEWVPREDRVKDYLTTYIAQCNHVAPPDWNGVIVMSGK
jgi:hypothetical protein